MSEPGLSQAEAQTRLRRDGVNELPHPDRRGALVILIGVLREPMLLLLLIAAGLYVLLGDARDALLLGVSVLLVIGLTLYQELRSENALSALRDLSSPRARVWRDGRLRTLAARELVVGDHIAVAEGDRIPADLELKEAHHLLLDESLLTGESVPVAKSMSGDLISERRLFAGTLVVRGHGAAVVVATGIQTDMGRIGKALQRLKSPDTPLQIEMRRIVLLFGLFSLLSCGLVTLLFATLRGDWVHALLAGVTLAMSNIPEEFPVVLAVFLALGAWRMAKHRALVRRAPAIEALGSVTVLCTDKTGTLTENRMALAELATSVGPSALLSETTQSDGQRLLQAARFASHRDTQDPMDRAILSATETTPAFDATLQHSYPLSTDFPVFAQVWSIDPHDGLYLACKGAPEAVAQIAGLSESARAAIALAVAGMASRGLRVLAVADADWPDRQSDLPASARDLRLQWRGLLGFADPLRKSVPGAVAEARAAGIRVLMLTGDHLETARTIARQAGLGDTDEVLLGSELDCLDEHELAQRLTRVNVFARVRPEHKLRLVRALAARGEVIAMTGDGVNDAPALLAANVGIAMGQRGTDVAREASSIVLLDDDFASIVRAVRMGRAIYDRISRAARYIVAVHVPITGLAVLPLVIDAPLILLPLHVVFLELIIDPACSIVFEQEPMPSDLMRKPPRAPGSLLIGLDTLINSLAQGAMAFLACLLVYALAGFRGLDVAQQAALTFVALVVGNLALILRFRAGTSSWMALRAPNRAFRWVVLLTITSLLLITGVPAAAAWFGFAPVGWSAWLIAAGLPLLLLIGMDSLLRRWRV